jgi:hypothetical protein
MEDYYNASLLEVRKPYYERKPVPEPKSTIASTMAIDYVQVGERYDVTDVRNRLILLCLRIREYRLKQKRLPTTIDVLRIDPSLLADPFTGKPFCYKPQSGNYLLYSMGYDLKDNGGVPADEKSQAHPYPGDLGLRRFQINSSGTQSRRYYRLVPRMKPPLLPAGAPPLYP